MWNLKCPRILLIMHLRIHPWTMYIRSEVSNRKSEYIFTNMCPEIQCKKWKMKNKWYHIHLLTTSIQNIRIQQLPKSQISKGHLERQPGNQILEKVPFENLLVYVGPDVPSTNSYKKMIWIEKLNKNWNKIKIILKL